MKYNKEYKIWVSKDGLLFNLRGVTNQAGYCGDGGLKVIAPHGWYHTDSNCYLYYKSTGVHRIVYETYKGKIPEGMEVDHIDRNKQNNSIDNLRLVTHKENCENRENLGQTHFGHQTSKASSNWVCKICGNCFRTHANLYEHKHNENHLGPINRRYNIKLKG